MAMLNFLNRFAPPQKEQKPIPRGGVARPMGNMPMGRVGPSMPPPQMGNRPMMGGGLANNLMASANRGGWRR